MQPAIIVPVELELTPRSRALIDSLVANALLPASKAGSDTPTGGLTPPALGAYWPGQGGFYAGKLPAVGDRPEVHMVFSEEEVEDLTWGPRDNDVTGAKSRHDGRANTKALLASGTRHPAAQWAAAREVDGHKDFHLPSQLELFMACIQVQDKFKKEGWYWSSTQDSPNGAFVQDLEFGGSLWYGKGHAHRVRAVRWIQL